MLEYHNETDFTKFKTENKYLFKLLYYSDDKEKIRQILNDVYNDDSLNIYVDKILLSTIGVSFDLETIIEIKNGKERVKMIKALEDIRNEGYQSGVEQERINAIQRMLKNGHSKTTILALNYTEKEYIEAENKLLQLV